MKLINDSPYDTRTLRSIAVAVYRWLRKIEGKPLPQWAWVKLGVGVKEPASIGSRDWYIRVPKLTGEEWHEAGRDIRTGSALTTEGFARRVSWWVERAYGSKSTGEVDPKALRHLRAFVPLKIIKPIAPRNRVRERYARILDLEKSWMRKQKLAGTKVRLYRNRRRYYERRLGKEVT